jgi:hypothetical protein
MQPHEVAGLQAIAKTQGTSLTINPKTGLPEAFSLGGFFSSLLPVFAGAATGGAGAPLWAGIAAGAATGALTNKKDPLMGAVTGGMGGYGGFNIGSGFANAGARTATPAAGGVQLSGSTVPTGTGVQFGQGAAQQIGTPQLNQSLAQSGVNFDPIARSTAQNIVSNTGPGVAFKNTFAQSALPGDAGYLGQGIGGTDIMGSGAIGSAVPGGSLSAQQSLANAGQGFENLVTGQEGSWDAFKQGLAGAGKAPVSNLSAATTLGMPIGSAVLGGLEPSDLYGDPMRPGQNPNEKYDPYKTLNLNTNTGLKLYAQGGPVSFADGGDALKGGGAGAMQGAGMVPLDVTDINAKYGYNPDEEPQSSGSMGIMGLGTAQSMPSVQVPVLGLFADNDQIETARSAYESQLAAAMAGRGGMGSTANASRMGRSMGTATGGPAATTRSGIAGLGSMGATADTAPTASTAETALSRLNINKQYAEGGTIAQGGLQDLYSTSDSIAPPQLSQDGYGLGRLQAMAQGGAMGYAKGGYLDGPGDGMSDSIPATIEGKQPARLADGEFVVPADVVSHLGNGSTKAGSQRLYNMLDKVRKARTGTKKQGKQINPNKFMPT